MTKNTRNSKLLLSVCTYLHTIYRGRACTAQPNAPAMYTHFMALFAASTQQSRAAHSAAVPNEYWVSHSLAVKARKIPNTDLGWN